LAAALIPAGIACGVLALMIPQGWAESLYFDFSAGLNVLDGPWVLGTGSQGWGLFAANIAITAVFFACINSVFALGEEFGWRGVMQTHLIGRFGFYRGVTFLGFVWAIWHLPVNLAGYNHPETPILGAFILFPIEHIATSFIMACLTLAARSFWPAVLFHGSINGIAQGLMSSLMVVEGVPSTTAKYVQIGLTIIVALICVLLTSARVRAATNTDFATDT
jgi:membrane protease YdiL (CAAX protease family)